MTSPGTAADIRQRVADLAARLDEAGLLDDPSWREVFFAVPRHAFIPDIVWVPDQNDDLVVVNRRTDPRRWWAEACGPEVVVTQINDGQPPPPLIPSSSCPMPSVIFEMLRALDVADGMRTLEIGTGTGYNAALLCRRLGEHNVTSIEVDASIADQAARALGAAGWQPHLVIGDGREGHPPNAPYDRVIGTCAVRHIPHEWVRQTRVGGVIVVPWVPPFAVGLTPLLHLTVDEDGTASGSFGAPLSFMRLREQRDEARQPLHHQAAERGEQPDVTVTDLNPCEILLGNDDVAFALGVQVPHCQCGLNNVNGRQVVWLSDTSPGASSWAIAFCGAPGATALTVKQYGPRRLWCEIESAYRLWNDLRRPAPDQFGLTVTPDRQYVWYGTPDGLSWNVS